MLLIFDLDGTLIDSSEDLAISTNATREHFALPPLPAHVIQSYVGNGAATLVKKALGGEVSDKMAAEGLAYFLEYYRAHSLQHTRLYEGIADAIARLTDEGHALAILTNKPYKISRDIVDGLGIAGSFFQVYGGDTFTGKKPDPIGITTLQGEKSAANSETWMIGDSGVDIRTARNAGVRACGVGWGFQPDTFEVDRPDHLVSKPDEWAPLFCG